jgi:muramoyltetrapeptide carboxypeptidase
MKKPKRLQHGDRIQIIIPASPVKPELFEAGMAVIRDLGYTPVHQNIDRKWRYVAGQDSERLQELLSAFNDRQSNAIFCARGGYGSGRLLPSLTGNFREKILLGCSDITSLHLYFQMLHSWIVFHGPMPSGDFARGQLHVESFQAALTQTGPYELRPDNIESLQSGSAEGILTGGCMTLLDSAIGTPWEPEWDGAILFLEDVSVRPYQIDRMLTHWKAAGKLSGVRGFIFGEMKDCIQVTNQGYTLQEVILDLLGDLNCPIYYNFPSGHVSGLNWTLPFGVRARASDHRGFALEILEAAVST